MANTNGWTTRPLGDLAVFRSGGTPSKAMPEYWNGSIPWISARDMQSMRISRSTHAITEAGAAQVILTPKGSVLVLVRGMGLFKDLPVVLCDRPMAFNQDIKSLIPKAGVDSAYLAYALLARKSEILRHVDHAGHGTGRLATHILESITLPVPPLPEQRKIAEILATWDRALAKLGELRTTTHRQKRGLMQASLAQRAFTGRLGEIGTLVRGRGIRRTDLLRSGVPCLRYGDIYTQYGHTTYTLTSFVSAEVASRCTPLKHGDIVFAASGETPDEIGSAVGWLGRSPAVVGGDTIILRNHGQNPIFIAHVVNSPPVVRQKRRLGKGQSVVHIHVRDLDGVVVPLPPLGVQETIATMLETWDRRVDRLQALEQETLRQKGSLMQRLFVDSHARMIAT